jgi:hypothetical protein
MVILSIYELSGLILNISMLIVFSEYFYADCFFLSISMLSALILSI